MDAQLNGHVMHSPALCACLRLPALLAQQSLTYCGCRWRLWSCGVISCTTPRMLSAARCSPCATPTLTSASSLCSSWCGAHQKCFARAAAGVTLLARARGHLMHLLPGVRAWMHAWVRARVECVWVCAYHMRHMEMCVCSNLLVAMVPPCNAGAALWRSRPPVNPLLKQHVQIRIALC